MYSNEFDSFYRPRRTEPRQMIPAPVPEEPRETPPERPRRRGRRIAAALLALVLLAGVFGGGYLAGGGRLPGMTEKTPIYMSGRVPVEVQPVAVTGTRELTMTELYATNVGRTVSIRVTTTSSGYNSFGQVTQSTSAGSGFLITETGFIVTNYHVVANSQNSALAKTATVTMYDGAEYEAQVIGGDKDYDIAVIKIDPGETKVTPVVIGDSAALQVGDKVAAIGNPLGELTFSMSHGIVSCVDRLINVDGTPFNMIQIDAAVNSGNSGGPLFNIYGEVVGIVSAKYSGDRSGTAASIEGLGFAIPINDVVAMVEDIMTNGFVSNKPSLSIFGQNFSPSMNPTIGTETGVYVNSVVKGGAAEKAGLRAGDVIVKIGDYAVASMSDITALKKHFTAGQTVTVEYYRDGSRLNTQLTFDATAQESQTETPPAEQNTQNTYGYYDPWEYFNRFFGGGW